MICLGDLVELDGYERLRGVAVGFGKCDTGKDYVLVYMGESDITHKFLLEDLKIINKKT